MFKISKLFAISILGLCGINNSFGFSWKVYNDLQKDPIYLQKGKISFGTLHIKVGSKTNPIAPNDQHGYMKNKGPIVSFSYYAKGNFFIINDVSQKILCKCSYSEYPTDHGNAASTVCTVKASNYQCIVKNPWSTVVHIAVLNSL